MKCRSVACIWSGTPPPHRVTAVAGFSRPPSFYTGGSDGSIIWWALSDSYSSPEVKAVGILCGHAAPITDLGTCSPTIAEKDTDSSSNLVVGSTSCDSSALISASTDGFLCVWSRSSGHCRCRRKLPPWVGSPCMIRTLPSRARYVCIGCSFMYTVHLSDHYSMNAVEGNDGLIDRDAQPRKPPKCTIVIVDTYSLAITQTVFHGNLSIGPMNFMTVVSVDNDKDSHSICVADSVGKQQVVSVPKDPYDQGENFSLNKDTPQLESSVWAEGLSGAQQIISIPTHGNVSAFVFKDHCIFRLQSCNTKLGEISFSDSLLCFDEHSAQAHAMGAMFLETVGERTKPNCHENSCSIPEIFVVWNNLGDAVVYKISYQNDIFQCEPHSEIPSTYYKPDMRVSIFFLQVYHWLLRIESVCFHLEDPSLWRPHVTIWSPDYFDNKHGKFYQLCRMLRERVSFTDLFENSAQLRGLNSVGTESTSSMKSLSDNIYEGQIVTSSMVISESLVAPYAVVYGFLSGLIEVVRFDLFQRMGLDGVNSKTEKNSVACKQYFSGHTGAILCLAAHQMMGSFKGQSFNHVLVSGSVDCTVRIWDLDAGCLIMVMHHHVAPVRQIILPPSMTDRPWSNCFLSIGDDLCVALVSLETLQVERMFPGHMNYPSKVVWNGARGYIACLCQAHTGTSDTSVLLYIWDVKTGCRERILRGAAAHSMFDHFCDSISINSKNGTLLNGNTSVSSLLLPTVEDGRLFKSSSSISGSLVTSSRSSPSISTVAELKASQTHADKANKDKAYSYSPSSLWNKKHPIKCSSPFPGIVALCFDLASLMFSYQKPESIVSGGSEPMNINSKRQEIQIQIQNSNHESQETREVLTDTVEGHDKPFEEYLLRFSLSFLHLWDVDAELDDLLMRDMKLRRPENFKIAAGLQGDRGSLTLTFPGLSAVLELWKSSAEFCAMRSLMMVSLAQRLISMSHFDSAASSSLAAFYTRNFTEKIPDVKPPSLQLLVAFWQAESEHVRMAARSLFHCAASHAIPLPLRNLNTTEQTNIKSVAGSRGEEQDNTGLKSDEVISQTEESNILAWLESFEVRDWISCVGGTSQDAMTSHIIVAAALAIWYPSLVKPSVAALVVHPLMKLAMAMNEKYSPTAAELLAEGMENTWKDCIGSEIPRLIGDIYFQIELSGSSISLVSEIPAVSVSIQQSLIEILLPSLAMADIPGFLTLVESQIWSTASDSPVHLISLMTIIRVMRGFPKNLAQYLDKVVNFILHTIDPSNSVMRKTCFQSSMTTLKELIRAYPMVAMNDTWTRLAVGDVFREVNNPSIKVYDMQSVTIIKVLDASGPPGLPSLLATATEKMLTAISALSFSPDGEGLVAFSEHGLMIRWWSLGSVWWEKLSRNLVPVQCTKVIFVPPWEGFSPNSSRSSIMANILGADGHSKFKENSKDPGHGDSLKQLLHNLDLSYRLEWVGDRKVLLSRHGHELGIFQL